jgi:hypothetical protein
MAGIDGFPGFIKSFTRGSTKDFTIQVKKDDEVLDTIEGVAETLGVPLDELAQKSRGKLKKAIKDQL